MPDDIGVIGLVAFVHGTIGDHPLQLGRRLIGHIEISQLVDTSESPAECGWPVMLVIDTGRHRIIATNDGRPGGPTSIVLGNEIS